MASGCGGPVAGVARAAPRKAAPPGSRSSVIASPSRQKDEICRIAGPDSPRWVNSAASSNAAPRRTARTGGGAREGREGRIGKGERHQRGARLGHRVAELPGDVIGQPGRAHLGDRLAPGGEHEVARVTRRARPRARAWRGKRCRHARGLSAASRATDRPPRGPSRPQHVDDLRGPPSQKSWPSVFSCQAMPWRSTRSMKSHCV